MGSFLKIVDGIAKKENKLDDYAFVEALKDDVLAARATGIEQRFNKTRIHDESLMQTITCVAFDKVSSNFCSVESEFGLVLKSKFKLPKPLLIKDATVFISISNALINGKRVGISLIKPEETEYIKHRKFTHSQVFATYENDYIFIHNTLDLKTISIRGLFQNPIKVNEFANQNIKLEVCNCDTCPKANCDNDEDEDCFDTDDFEIEESLVVDIRRILGFSYQREVENKEEIKINE